jgi:cytochrome b6-f complex iron-sulfur subunit
MDRRDFLGWIGVGLVASSLPVALAACNKQTNNIQSSNSDEFQAVGTLKELEQQGYLLNEQLAVLVIRDQTNPEQIKAVNPTCTHAGCTVNWKADQSKFVCPCHNSQFFADGSLANGPAKEPLTSYEAKLEGEQILVKLA